MDEDAKVHWAETIDKPRYRQFTISGEPWAIWLQDKNIRMNLLLLYELLPTDRKLGKTWEIWARYLL
jgi:hypothetical protein